MKKSTVVIYDPNTVNRYGFEVSMMLEADEFAICLLENHPRTVAGTQSSILRRVCQQLRTGLALYRVPISTPLTAIWIRNPIDLLALCLRSIRGGKTLIVRHNPVTGRYRKGIVAFGETWLLRRSTAIYHAAWLRAADKIRPAQTHILPHPPYLSMSASLDAREFVQKRFALVGALRPDKGSEVLARVLKALPSGCQVLTVGPDQLPQDLRSELEVHGVQVLTVGGDGQFVSQEVLVAEMSKCTAMLAPYTNPTASGSVMLALSLGIPCLGLQSRGLAEVLCENSMAETPEALGILAGVFADQPWWTYKFSRSEYLAKARSQWSVVLSGHAQ